MPHTCIFRQLEFSWCSQPAVQSHHEVVMKKLKLESLEVTSFETGAGPHERGTIRGRSFVPTPPLTFGPCQPTDPNFDCTYGCSQDTGCPENCMFTMSVD